MAIVLFLSIFIARKTASSEHKKDSNILGENAGWKNLLESYTFILFQLFSLDLFSTLQKNTLLTDGTGNPYIVQEEPENREIFQTL